MSDFTLYDKPKEDKKTFVIQESRIHIFTVTAKDEEEALKRATELDHCNEDNWSDTDVEIMQEVRRKK